METVQDSIPIRAVHERYNLIETYEGAYTKSFRLLNINYSTATESEQESLMSKWRDFLNSLGYALR